MHLDENEEKLLRSVALQNANAVLLARERAEQALEQKTLELAEQREYYRVTLSSIGDAVITTDIEARVTFLNPVAETMTGWKSSEALGQPLDHVFRIVNENTREPVPNPVSKVLRDGLIVGLAHHTALIARDGTETAIEDSAAPIRDAGGKISGVVMVFHDVTERRRSEQSLRQSEGLKSAVLSAALDAIITMDHEGNVADFNPAAERIFGYARADVVGKQLAELIIPERFRQRHRDGLKHYLATGEGPVLNKRIELPGLRADGSEFPAELSISPISGAGSPMFTATLRDITERQRTEEALRESEQFNRSIIESSRDCIKVLDLDGNLLLMAAGGQRMLNIEDLQPYLGKSWIEFWQGEHRDAARAAVQAAVGGAVGNFVGFFRTLKGEPKWWDVLITLIRDAQGRPERLLAVSRDVTEREQAEERLRRSEKLLTDFFENGALALHWVGADGVILKANRTELELLGYSADEYIGRSISEFHADRPVIEDILKKLKCGETLENYEARLRCKDGSIKHVVIHSNVLWEDGKFVHTRCFTRDITKQKQAEEALRRSEEELRSLADSIPQLAWMAQPDGHIFWYNRKWYEYTGTTLQGMEGWGWQSVHDPKILPQVLEGWTGSIRTGQPFEMEFPLRGADGEFRWFLTRVNPVRDAEGRVVRWFGTNTDVDTVRRAQEALRDETRILELLNDTGTAIAANLDLQSLVQTVTDAATQLTGAKFGAFFYNVINEQGESLLLYTLSGAPREAFEKFGLPRNTPIFNPTFQGQGVVRSGDITKDPRYGTMSPHHGMPKGHLPVRSYLAVPVVSRNGNVIGGLFFGHPETDVFTERSERLTVGVAAQAAIAIDNARLYEAAQREIAERKRVEEELRTAQGELSHYADNLEKEVASRTASLREAMAQLEEFSYSVSHDLRAPIRAIEGYARLLDEDYGKTLPPGAHPFLEKISRNAERMQRLVTDVLTMSRIARAQIKLRPIPLQRFIEEIVEHHAEMQAPAADISITTPHTVIADASSLNQAISNLVANAVKFVPAGTKPILRIRSELNGERVRILVEDNGIGIPPEHRGKLFGMFQRLPNSGQFEGTGIGLAIVRKAVERMGGTVGMESNENKGSRFWLELKGQP